LCRVGSCRVLRSNSWPTPDPSHVWVKEQERPGTASPNRMERRSDVVGTYRRIKEESNQVPGHTKSTREGAKGCPPSPSAGCRPAVNRQQCEEVDLAYRSSHSSRPPGGAAAPPPPVSMPPAHASFWLSALHPWSLRRWRRQCVCSELLACVQEGWACVLLLGQKRSPSGLNFSWADFICYFFI
jgi:hypothetical protein